MWLEILVGLAAGGLTFLGIAFPVIAPEESKRLSDAIRAHIPASIARHKLRRLSIDMVAELSVEVDMKWWDDQFAKLLPSAKRAVEAWNRSHVYNPSAYLYTYPQPQEVEQLRCMDEYKMLLCEFKKWEPAMPEWQRIKLARNIASARNAEEASIAWDAARAALDGEKRARLNPEVADSSCKFCEYIEQITYGGGSVGRMKTGLCSKCLAEEKERHETARSMAAWASVGTVSASDASLALEKLGRPDVSSVMRAVKA